MAYQPAMWTRFLGAIALAGLVQGGPAIAGATKPEALPWETAIPADLPVVAQDVPVGPNPSLPTLEELAPTDPVLEEIPPGDAVPTTVPPSSPIEGTPPPEEPAPTITVQSITVVDSTVFSEAELAAAVAPFVGRSLTLAELQQAADAVTQLYLNAGYLTSEAVLPPQDIGETGQVTLTVIEGFLEEIRVEGSERLTTYVQQRVGLAGLAPVNQASLEAQLQLLKSDPLFDNVEAGLRQGQTPGGSVLIVRVTEAPAFSGSIGLDTLSPRSVGQFRTGAILQYLNLAGLGDRLVASAYRSTTGGSNAYELSYQVPLNPMNGTLLLRATPNNYRITDPNEPSFALDARGSTDHYEILFRQPLIRTPQEEFALSAGFGYRQGSTLLLGFITPPTVTSVFSFGQDYVRRDATGIWGIQSQFRLGTGLFNATTSPLPGPDGKFWSWQGQVQRWQVLNPTHQLLLRGSAQFTTDSLLGSEQFFAGGAQSVRGYYQNERFGDNGLQFSIEDHITLQRDLNGRVITRIIPFFDVGYVWANNPAFSITRQNWMVGTGVALETEPIENLTARVDFGFPLIKLDELASDRPAGLRVYFDVRYRF